MPNSDSPRSMQETAKSVSRRLVGERNTRRLIEVRRRAIAAAMRRTAAGRASQKLLSDMKDRHRGETCVLIGNGPSLNNTNLALAASVPTIGLNRIYLMFDKIGFKTTYHVVVNSFVVDQCADDFAQLQAPLFTTWKNANALRGRSRPTAFLNSTGQPMFGGENIDRGVWEGATVTYVAMQLAYHLGFKRVVLVGVDHRFKSEGPAHKLIKSDGPDPNHFDPNYFGKGFKWQLPDLETSEIAYGLAKAAFEADGREILDATVNGALTVFPKVSLEDALSE